MDRNPMNKPVKKTKKRLRLMGFLLISFLSLAIVQFYQGHKKLELMYLQIDELQKRIQYMNYDNQKLLAMLDQVGSPAYVERIAREELGLVKRGEILIITID